MPLTTRARRWVHRMTADKVVGETPVVKGPAGPPPPLPDLNTIGHFFVQRTIDTERLGQEAGTDLERLYYQHRGAPLFKWAHYLPTYDRLLKPFVGKPVTLVEIGLAGGGSLELWRAFLGPQIRIIGVDLAPGCKAFQREGVEIMIGDQGDAAFMASVAEAAAGADIVIDDGSHICAHQILAFETLFPVIKTGGVYICEDLHTSYWPEYGGGLGSEDSFITYAKQLVDRLHLKYGFGGLPENDVARQIGTMTVTDSLIAVDKVAEKDVFIAWVGQHSDAQN